jgi:hypothetical protein
MLKARRHQYFKVKLALYAAGPVRPRTKYKEHKLLRGEGCINLPFVPYPGLYITMQKPRKRGEPLTLYLRVRTVEWNLQAQHFECMVDEMMGSSGLGETYEVRGGSRIEQHFVELEKSLRIFGFSVITNTNSQLALDRYPDGSWIVPPEPIPPHFTPHVRGRRHGFE